MSMAEDYIDAFDIENEYERIREDAERGIWTARDGSQIAVSNMRYNHIVNTINMLKRNDSCDMYLPWIKRFEAELQQRRGEKQRMTRTEARQFIIDHCCPNYENPDNTQWDTAMVMAIEALGERERMLSWLSKFCRHIDMGDRPYTDAEAYEFWKNKMHQQFGWEVDE